MTKIFSLLLIALVLVSVVIGSGGYNIAATEKHWNITEKIIAWVRDSSIETHAKELRIPPLDEAELLSSGAEHYHAMCTICHLAPGLKPTELSIGLYPQAPVFHQREAINDPARLSDRARAYFWVIKNGLKMTAMPAWGLSHDDRSIWGMTAFILKMSNMTPEQYENLVNSAKADSHSHSHADEHKHNEHTH
jgi:hypothetical protein